MPGCHTASRHQSQQKLLVGLLARLVGNAAAGLAGALAGSLALAAAAVQQALSHVAGLESLDVLHKTVTPLYILELYLLYTGLDGLSRVKYSGDCYDEIVGGGVLDAPQRADMESAPTTAR